MTFQPLSFCDSFFALVVGLSFKNVQEMQQLFLFNPVSVNVLLHPGHSGQFNRRQLDSDVSVKLFGLSSVHACPG